MKISRSKLRETERVQVSDVMRDAILEKGQTFACESQIPSTFLSRPVAYQFPSSGADDLASNIQDEHRRPGPRLDGRCPGARALSEAPPTRFQLTTILSRERPEA